MKLAVVGSCCFKDWKRLCSVLDEIRSKEGIECIISGGAKGADKNAEAWADLNGIPTQIFNAEWKKYKKAAGPIRNTKIVEAADEVIAFWNGSSTGTLDTISKAEKVGKMRMVYRF